MGGKSGNNRQLEELEAEVQKLIDQQEVMEVIYRFMSAMDSRDWVGLRKLLIEESTFASPRFGPQRGPDQIEANIKRALGHIDATLHVVTNEVTEITGDRAHVSFYVNAHHLRRGVEGGETFTNRSVHNHDLIRTQQGWKILNVKAKPAWGEGNPKVRVREGDSAS